MTFSILTSDLSRSVQLQRAGSSLKNQLAVLTEEVTTGLKKDVAASQRGEMGHVAQLEARLGAIDAYSRNAALAASDLEAIQTALNHMQTLSGDRGPALLSHAAHGNPITMTEAAREAVGAFGSVVGALNVQAGGRYLLSGAATDTAPISSADNILAAVRATALAQPTAADAIAAIDAWFDGPAGSGGFMDTAYHGGDTHNCKIAVSADRTLTMPADAADPRLRDVLKGLALSSLVADPPPGQTDAEKAEILSAAGTRLARGNDAVILLRASVGVAQEAVEAADVRNGAEKTALSIARTGLLSADPFETATALREVEGRMESLYAVVARLSRLSLADYL